MGLFSNISNNFKKSANSLFGTTEKSVNTLKAVTRNTNSLLHIASGGVLSATTGAFASGNPLLGTALLPLAGALGAVDLTLSTVVSIEDQVFPKTNPHKLSEEEFIKSSTIGHLAEQFLRGDISESAVIGTGEKVISTVDQRINDLSKTIGTEQEVSQAKKEVDELGAREVERRKKELVEQARGRFSGRQP